MAKKATLVKKAAKKAAKKVTPKAAPKKAAPKKEVKEEKKKDEISAKKVGKNLIVIIDGKKYTKTGLSDTDVKSIEVKILLYNKLNSPDKKEEILRLVDKTVEIKETKKAVKAGIKTLQKKEKKETKKEIAKVKEVEKDKMTLINELSEKASKDGLNKEETENLKKLMKIAGFVEEKQEIKPQTSTTRRSGEY